MADNMQDWMTATADDVPERKLVPPGEYVLLFRSYKPGQSQNEDKTQFVRLNFKPVEQRANALDPAAELIDDFSLYENVSGTMFLTPASSEIAIRQLKDSFGVDMRSEENKGMTFGDAFEIAHLNNTHVRAIVKIEEWGNGNKRAVVDSFLRMDG